MEKLKFSTLHFHRLSNEDAGAVLKLNCESAEPLQPTIGEMAVVALNRMKLSSNKFIAQINRMQKSMLTEQVVTSRKKCSDVLADIKRTVAFETKSRDNHKKEAAIKLEFFFKPYWNINRSPVGTQYELTAEMITKYNALPELKDAAILINIDTLIPELETKNIAFGKVYKDRNLEISEREESGTELRKAATDDYQIFCNVIELAADLIPNADIKKLFNQMEELRKKYHALIPHEEITTDESDGEVDPEV